MRRQLVIFTLLLLAAFATPALAAPDFNGSLSAASTTLAWEGTAYGTNIQGEPCDTDHSCEDMLVDVGDAGNVTIKWEATAPAGPAWLGVTVYKSDASGAEGAEVADGGGLEDTGTLAAKVQAGFYIVRVSGLLTSTATYKATATLKPSAPPAQPAPAPATTPPAQRQQQPASQPKPSSSKKTKKKSCKGKKGQAKKRCMKKNKRR
jgi:hypothetical protein